MISQDPPSTTRQLGALTLNVVNGLREFARASPAVTAVVDRERRATYGELDERSNRLASALLAGGLERGDCVAVLFDNRLEFIESISAIAKAGLVIVPLNPRLTPPEVEYILGHSEARGLLFAEEFAGCLPDSAHALDVVVAVPGDPAAAPATGATSYEAFLAGGEAVDPMASVEGISFCIAYTSGTTGKPKGVQLTHAARALLHYMAALEWGLGVGRVSLAVAPMYHGAGLSFAYAPIATGGTVVLLRHWNAQEMLSLVASERAQAAFLVPTHASALKSLGPDLHAHDLSSLDTLYFNAAALPVTLKEWVMAEFPDVRVYEIYGSTEASVVTALRHTDALAKAGSVGHGWYMTEVKLLDDDGQPVPAGVPGELWSRSPLAMSGYLKDPAATDACSTPDGFISAGDIAIADEDGFISIIDRKKDVIISGGINIYPREIEEVMLRFPGVSQVAVVGVPDEKWGETVAAFVVPDPGTELVGADLDAQLATRVASYKRPRRWEFVSELPRNASGKVLKRELRETLAPR
jgi:acyl-CoA synthetase (AMP-forming)/AMP-acid ligase II